MHPCWVYCALHRPQAIEYHVWRDLFGNIHLARCNLKSLVPEESWKILETTSRSHLCFTDIAALARHKQNGYVELFHSIKYISYGFCAIYYCFQNRKQNLETAPLCKPGLDLVAFSALVGPAGAFAQKVTVSRTRNAHARKLQPASCILPLGNRAILPTIQKIFTSF